MALKLLGATRLSPLWSSEIAMYGIIMSFVYLGMEYIHITIQSGARWWQWFVWASGI